MHKPVLFALRLAGMELSLYHGAMPDKNDRPVIGVFTKQLDNWTSGSGHHLNEIMKRVVTMNDRFRFVFIHYAPSENPIYEKVEELIIPRNPLAATFALRKRRFDILHHTPLTVYSPIWGLPAKRVATIHGAEQLLVPEFYGAVEMAHERYLVPVYARRMDHIVTVSNTSKEFFVRRYGIPPEKITVCYNGVGPGYRILDKTSLTAPTRYGTGEKFAFHLSRFSERKNPWTLLDGFARFAAAAGMGGAGGSWKLVIGGKGWDNSRVLERIARTNLRGRVVLTGFLNETDSVELLNAAAAFVFPSLAEGFGMPNVEAMACGCPVVTSNVFAVPEVVGDAALVMKNPRDPAELATLIGRVVGDMALRQKLVDAGRRRLPLFDWDESARKVMGVYEGLTGGEEVF
jgi:glycosyltransferase involved in cell wall biosynthesis